MVKQIPAKSRTAENPARRRFLAASANVVIASAAARCVGPAPALAARYEPSSSVPLGSDAQLLALGERWQAAKREVQALVNAVDARCSELERLYGAPYPRVQYGWYRRRVYGDQYPLFASTEDEIVEATAAPIGLFMERRAALLQALAERESEYQRLRNELGIQPLTNQEDEAWSAVMRIELEIMETPAEGPAGAAIKLRVTLEQFPSGTFDGPDENLDPPYSWLKSVMRDLERLAAEGGKS